MSVTTVALLGEFRTSTAWVGQPALVRVTWLSLLLLADEDGELRGSLHWLAFECGLNLETCETAIGELGKKGYVESVEGGWRLTRESLKYRVIRTRKQVLAARRQQRRRQGE